MVNSKNKHKNLDIKDVYKTFSTDISRINDLIIENCDAKSPLIKEMSSYIIESGGKRIRPILVLISNLLINSKGNKNVYNLCAAVELIHTATLLHDDVIDNSFLRRGEKTANAIWDNKASILVGDFLFSLAFQLMVKTDSIKILNILSTASNTIADGEVNQLQNSNNIEISLEKYFEIIEGKTAALFAASCSSGAALAGANDKEISAMDEIGKNIGILFQITDDLMDYGHGRNSLGKNIGDDYFESKVTIPVIICLSKASPDDKSEMEELFFQSKDGNRDPKNLEKVIQLLTKYESFNESIKLANDYFSRSNDLLLNFSNNIYVEYLKCITETVINRIK